MLALYPPGSESSHAEARDVDHVDARTGPAQGHSGNGVSGLDGRDARTPFNLYQFGFDASWEIDIWGRTRRAIEAADALTFASAESRHAVILSVVSEVAANYIRLRTAQATLASVKRMVAFARDSLALTENRCAAGAATKLEVSEASAQLHAITARIPDLETEIEVSMNALSLLLGEQPGSLAEALAQETPIPPVPSVAPIGLPSELARRRPDIREAEARLHAATATIGMAKADFYPSVTLSGSFGTQSLNFATLGSWASRQFAIGPTLHLPIFEGGRLVSTLRLREVQQQTAAISYQKTVLSAWNEIDNTLTAFDGEQRRRSSLQAAVDHGRTAREAARARYKAGSVTFLDVLVIERALLENEVQLIRTQGNVSLTAVRLYRALGGGWEISAAGAHDG